jgi:hypothetical protein
MPTITYTEAERVALAKQLAPLVADLLKGTTPHPDPDPETPTPPNGPTLPAGNVKGIWIGPDEIAKLPMTGAAWQAVFDAAKAANAPANLADLNDPNDTRILAAALVAVRTGDDGMRAKVAGLLESTRKNTPYHRVLEMARGIQSVVLAADIIGYRDAAFEGWLRELLTKPTKQGHSGPRPVLLDTALYAPNNWGLHAAAAVTIIARYLGDDKLLKQMAETFQRFTGDVVTGGSYVWDPTNWHTSTPKRGINAPNVKYAGAMPEDMRRGSETASDTPVKTGYAREAMQGLLVWAMVLHRAGYPAFQWGDRAVLRAEQYLQSINWQAEGDDAGYPHIVNAMYGTNFKAGTPAGAGKNMLALDWIFGGKA